MKQYVAYYVVGEEQVAIGYFDSIEEAKACLEGQKRQDIKDGAEKEYYGISIED